MLDAIAQGVAGNAAWHSLTKAFTSLRGISIKMASPRPQEALVAIGKIGNNTTYEVKGKLNHLPRDHMIWLPVQDEQSGRLWPQGFESVQYDRSTGEWVGAVTDISTKTTKIIAVVTPPTSADFFLYYQEQGAKTDFAPLKRVPPECRDRDYVQAKVP